MRSFFKHSFLAAAMAGAGVLASPVFANDETVDGVAASINGEAVTIREVTLGVPPQIAAMSAEPGFQEMNRAAIVREAFRRSLEEQINRRLIIQAYRAGTARIPESALEKIRAEIIEKNHGGDTAALRAELEANRMTYDDWKRMLEEQQIVRLMRQQFVDSNVNVSPNDIRREHETRKMAHILIHAVEDGEGADEALAEFARRLAAGETFEELAKESSIDDKADVGGDYGWIDPGKELAPALAAAANSLAVGELSPPVKLGPRRYLIFRREIPLHEAVEMVAAELRARESARLYDAWIARLRSDAAIKRFAVEGMTE